MVQPQARRTFLKTTALASTYGALARLSPAWASPGAGRPSELRGPEIDLTIREQRLPVAGGVGAVITVNESVPAPLLRFREGEEVTIRVKNLAEAVASSIHWHGLRVDASMDGTDAMQTPVPPGISFTLQGTELSCKRSTQYAAHQPAYTSISIGAQPRRLRRSRAWQLQRLVRQPAGRSVQSTSRR